MTKSKKKRPVPFVEDEVDRAAPSVDQPADSDSNSKTSTKKSKKSPSASASKQSKADGKQAPIDWDGQAGRLVGARIQHWWDGDESWFCGRIIKYSAAMDKHLVKFDIDGEEEWLVIQNESILYCEQVRVGARGGCAQGTAEF
jgi:hypothetical protein